MPSTGNRRDAYALLNHARTSPWVCGKENAKHMNEHLAKLGQCAIKGCKLIINIRDQTFKFYWVDVNPAPEAIGLYVCMQHGDGTSKDASKLYDSEMAATEAFPGLKDIGYPITVCNWRFSVQKCNFEAKETPSLCNKIYKGDADVRDEELGEKRNKDGTVPEMMWVCYKPECLERSKNWARS